MRAIELGSVDGEPFTLTPRDRSTHLHIIGPSQGGKSKLATHLIRQDILAGHGVCVIDPQGGLYRSLAKWCASLNLHRRRKLHFIDPNSDDWVFPFNPLQCQPGEDVAKRVDAAVVACATVWGEDSSRTPLLKRCLRAVFTALVEHNLPLAYGLDLISQSQTVSDETLKARITTDLNNEWARRVWAELHSLRSERLNEVLSSTNNRFAEFAASPRMLRMLGTTAGALDLRACMDHGQVVIINLQRRQLSTDNARLIGTLIFNELLQVARARPSQERPETPFTAYVDEAYLFLTPDIEQALDETRQKGLYYVLLHQRLRQLEKQGPEIFDAVMGIRNKIVFGDLQTAETEVLARELFQAEYDENAEIDALRRPVVVGHRVRQNRQVRMSAGTGTTQARSDVRSRGLVQSEMANLSLATDALGNPISGQFTDAGGMGHGQTVGQAHGEVAGESASKSASVGVVEALEPILEDRPGGLRSFDDQMHAFAQKLRSLPERHVVVKLRGRSPVQVSVPFVAESVLREERCDRWLERIAAASEFAVRLEDLRGLATLVDLKTSTDVKDLIEPDDFWS